MNRVKVLNLDARRRGSLLNIGRGRDRLYFASVAEDGTITLTPAVVVPAKLVSGS